MGGLQNNMDQQLPPLTEDEQVQLMALLQAYEQGAIGANEVPDDLKALLDNVQKAKGQPTEAVDAEEVTPEPCFVVKTTDVPTGRKVFINICSSSVVPPPRGWDRGASMPEHVAAALDKMQGELSDSDAEALRFPLSCGDLRSDTDKSGKPCCIVDCILNPDVAVAAGRSRPLKAFLVELALGWVGSKHKLDLDMRFKLPKMAYKGSAVAVQRVRKERAPLVTEVTEVGGDEEPTFPLPLHKASTKYGTASTSGAAKASSSRAAAGGDNSSSRAAHAAAAAGQPAQQRGSKHGTAETAGAAGAAACVLPQLQHSIECEGRPVTALLITVQLPPGFNTPNAAPSVSGRSSSSGSGITGGSISVEVCGQQVEVAVAGCEPLSIRLTFAATAAGATARVTADGRLLQLRLPYLPVTQLVTKMQQEKPHGYGELGLSADSYMELEP